MKRWYLLGFLLAPLLSACPYMETRESTELQELAARESDDEGSRNLAAVRAMLSDEKKLRGSDLNSTDNQTVRQAGLTWPPDWMGPYLSARIPSDQESDLPTVYAPSSPAPSRRSALPPDVTVRIPRTNSPPSRYQQSDPIPRVPAYTVPAPTGSPNAGAGRCVPDLLGGQRCN